MAFLRLARRIVFAVLLVLTVNAHSQAQITSSQGIPAHTVQIPVPLGFVSATTGQIHLEVPIGLAPQRGGDSVIAKLVYDTDSRWQLKLGNSHYGTASYQSSSQDCTLAGFPGWPFGSVTKYSAFYFQDSSGTRHAIVNDFIYTKQVNCQNNQGQFYGSGSDITSTNGVAADGSGYSFSISNYSRLLVSSADGTIVYDSTGAIGGWDTLHDSAPLRPPGQL